MQKLSIIEKIPDSMRENLDFLGQVHCPIKDRYSRLWKEFQEQYNSTHETKLRGAVPMGGCGIDAYYNISAVESREKYPSVVTDTGFAEFFTGDFLETPKKLAWFSSRPLPDPVNPLFRNLDLKDPRGIFTIYGAMPYVFLVNHKRLEGRPAPRRIADLTAADYDGSVGVGFAPDDISELLLLEIWKEQGERGIRALAHTIGFTGRAPEMAADAVANRDGVCVYLISWFFAHAVPKRSHLEIVWPEDGALFSPLYALFKDEETERQKACGEFLFGPELGRIMAGGWFAHVHPGVHHAAPEGASLRWTGWDYLYEKKVTRRVEEIEAVYYDERRLIRPDEKLA
jgi:ABC-type Fe3+ transport system substrate-binding protein